MIKGIVIVNNHGKPRLVKFYQPVASEAQQQTVIRRIFQHVSSRPDSFCNYLETMVCPEWGGYRQRGSDAGAGAPAGAAPSAGGDAARDGGDGDDDEYYDETSKLIYRHYATLYFCFCVDRQESDLGILDLIQVFVEALDKAFGNVCELDLIFHSDRVHYILDEIVMGGMVLETNIHAILQATKDQDAKHEASLGAPLALAGAGGGGGDASGADGLSRSSQTARVVQQLGGGSNSFAASSAAADQQASPSQPGSTWAYNW